jgi:hypothetical protein
MDSRPSYRTHSRDGEWQFRHLVQAACDVLHVLKNGFVYEAAQPSSRPKFWKYQVQGRTPNSGNREVRGVVIPSVDENHLKVITVMWADEPLAQGR